MDQTIKRIALASPVVAAFLASAVFGLTKVGSTPVGCGEEPVIGVAGARSSLADGRGTPAIAGDKIVVLEGLGNRSSYLPATGAKGVLRHVAASLGQGTVYVDDRRGPDAVVVIRPHGVSEIVVSGEATHPSWSTAGDVVWAEDFKMLKISSPPDQSPKTVAPPEGSTAVFSPIFTDPSQLVAVVQEPVKGYDGEDDSLNNLYRFDTLAETWTRVTSFDATAENWSVLRTPIVARDGSVLFVRLRGAASQTRPPSFELWTLRGDSVKKVRDLPKEMFLAGADDRGLLWNTYDGTEWRLSLEGMTGLIDLGCGAVMVDPRSQPDPDIPKEDPLADRRSSVGRRTAVDGSAGLVDAEMAILVGDFSSRDEAESVLNLLRLPGLRIVTQENGPFAIAPGKWGVAKLLPADADLTSALEEFRRRFPQFAGRTWVVSLAGGTT